jgi:predicted amidohydrolase
MLFLIPLMLSAIPALADESPASKNLVVAAVQMRNLDGDYEQSRAIAERMVGEAAERGARLVLLPEFALIGYRFHDDLWKMAEPLEGRTVAWMRELCRRYGIYLATCILEVRENDFHDTLVLVGPGEGELWAHRKIEPALFEARYFKGGGLNPAVFETPLGRIGVAICFDTSKTHTIQDLLQGRPDLVLMTFSAPETPIVPRKMQRESLDLYTNTPAQYAQILGVPVVSVNKTGRFNSPFPILPIIPLHSDFMARSRIVDAEGKVLAGLEKEEAVIVSQVTLGSGIAPPSPTIPDGRWLVPYSSLMRWFSDWTLKKGERRYEKSRARVEAVKRAR